MGICGSVVLTSYSINLIQDTKLSVKFYPPLPVAEMEEIFFRFILVDFFKQVYF
jgi:hypothetical protein